MFYYTKYRYFIMPFVDCLPLISFKNTEYGLDNPTNNHKSELYETYQYVTAKNNYQNTKKKE